MTAPSTPGKTPRVKATRGLPSRLVRQETPGSTPSRAPQHTDCTMVRLVYSSASVKAGSCTACGGIWAHPMPKSCGDESDVGICRLKSTVECRMAMPGTVALRPSGALPPPAPGTGRQTPQGSAPSAGRAPHPARRPRQLLIGVECALSLVSDGRAGRRHRCRVGPQPQPSQGESGRRARAPDGGAVELRAVAERHLAQHGAGATSINTPITAAAIMVRRTWGQRQRPRTTGTTATVTTAVAAKAARDDEKSCVREQQRHRQAPA